MAWNRLSFDATGRATDFDSLVVEPVRRVASSTIDSGAVIAGILLPGSVIDRVQSHYRRLLFGDLTLQDLPADEK